MTATVVGVGELVLDHVFEEEKDGTRYLGCRGGGSIGNVLANIVAHGGTAGFVGVGGDDRAAEVCAADLALLGVERQRVELRRGKFTRQIFELSFPDARVPQVKHEFVARCPVCGRQREDELLAKVRASDLRALDLTDARVLCVDRLTTERARLARDSRRLGLFTALDLGRMSYLRWLPAAAVADSLTGFDLIQVPRPIAVSLAKRLGRGSAEELATVHSDGIFVTTDAERGCEIISLRDRGKLVRIHVDAPKLERVIDDAGAGDALLGYVLAHVARSTRTGGTSGLPRSISVEFVAESVRGAMKSVEGVLEKVGARGHLPGVRRYGLGKLAQSGSDLSATTVVRVGPETECCVCGSTAAAGAKAPRSVAKVGARRNIQFLLGRTFHAGSNGEATTRARSLFEIEGTAYAVGTGGSYATAVFAASVLRELGRLFCQAIHPFDFLRTARHCDCVIVFSYSGNTPDCASVIRRAIALNVTRIVLFTRDPEGALCRLLRDRDMLIAYGQSNSRGERGFVSIAGTVAPCAVMLGAKLGSREMAAIYARSLRFAEESALRNSLVSIGERLRTKRARQVSVFGTGAAWPAVTDLESKIVETGVAVPLVHEVKDFSHGRFMSLFGHGGEHAGAILLNVGGLSDYERSLERAVMTEVPLVTLKAEMSGAAGALEMMLLAQYAASWLGDGAGVDLSRPARISSQGLALYRFSGLA